MTKQKVSRELKWTLEKEGLTLEELIKDRKASAESLRKLDRKLHTTRAKRARTIEIE